MSNLNNLTFGEFDEFIDRCFEDLCNCEQRFTLQSSADKNIQYVQTNSENIKNLVEYLVSVHCKNDSFDNLFAFVKYKLRELEELSNIMINNLKSSSRSEKYQDKIREELYEFLLRINQTVNELKRLWINLITKTQETQQILRKQMIEKLAMVMMETLDMMDRVDTGMYPLKDEIQNAASLMLIVMNKYHDELK